MSPYKWIHTYYTKAKGCMLYNSIHIKWPLKANYEARYRLLVVLKEMWDWRLTEKVVNTPFWGKGIF